MVSEKTDYMLSAPRAQEELLDHVRMTILWKVSWAFWPIILVGTMARHIITPLRPVVMGICILSAGLFFAIALAPPKRPFVRISSQAALFGVFLLILAGMQGNGGPNAPIAPLLLLLPMLAMFFLGGTAAVLYAVVAALALGTFFVLNQHGYLPNTLMNKEQVVFARVLLMCLFLCLFLATAWLYHQTWKGAGKLTQCIVNHAPDHIFFLDKEGRILSTHESTQHSLQHPAHELRGQCFFELLMESRQGFELKEHWEDRDTFAANTKGKYFSCQLSLSKGRKLPLELVFEPADIGGVSYILVFGRDISERLKLERAKEELFVNTAHALKTPLTSSFGALRLLHATALNDLPPAQKHLMSIAHRNTQIMVDIINDLKNLEEYIQGDTDYNFEEADIIDLLKLALSSTELLASDKSVHFERELPDTPVICQIDRLAIIQVLTTMLTLAIKYALPSTKIQVALHTNLELDVVGTAVYAVNGLLCSD